MYIHHLIESNNYEYILRLVYLLYNITRMHSIHNAQCGMKRNVLALKGRHKRLYFKEQNGKIKNHIRYIINRKSKLHLTLKAIGY